MSSDKPLIHLATVTHLTHRSKDRYRINLGGTQSVFNHCDAYGLKQAVFVGRHTYYGAAPDSPLYHTETEPPMAGHTFPEPVSADRPIVKTAEKLLRRLRKARRTSARLIGVAVSQLVKDEPPAQTSLFGPEEETVLAASVP